MCFRLAQLLQVKRRKAWRGGLSRRCSTPAAVPEPGRERTYQSPYVYMKGPTADSLPNLQPRSLTEALSVETTHAADRRSAVFRCLGGKALVRTGFDAQGSIVTLARYVSHSARGSEERCSGGAARPPPPPRLTR